MSCLLWEDEFYEDGAAIADRLAGLVKEVPAKDAAALAIRAKEDMRIRHAPLLVARELMRSKEGRALAGELFPRVITRADDITEFLAMYWRGEPGSPLAAQVKKHLGATFQKFDEYQLAKYRGDGKKIKLRDAIRMLRPKPRNDEEAALWGRLVRGTLATPDTWEVALSAATDQTAAWTRLLDEDRLGGMAMLRNLRNMEKAKVDPAKIRDGIRRIQAGKLLPINFIAAARAAVAYENVIEEKFLECFANRPTDEKSTILLIDVSGSMDAALSQRSDLRRVDAACGVAMIAREAFKNITIYTFSNGRVLVPARRGFALRDAILASQPHGGTELGGALQNLPSHQRLIVITDEQSASAVPQMKGYMINVASAQNGVGYGVWTHIDGWSDKTVDYILACEKVPQ